MPVITTLRFADPVLISLAMGSWILAAWYVQALPYASGAGELCRRSERAFALVGLGLSLSLVWLCVDVAATHRVAWSSVPLCVAAVLTILTSVPRLRVMRMATRAFRGVHAMAPVLRRDGADPWLVGPIQINAYVVAATLAEFALGKAGLAPVAQLRFAVLAATVVAVAVTWGRLVRRHQRLANAVIVPGGRTRMLPGQGVLGALGMSATALALVALVATAPPAAAQNVNLDRGGIASSTVDK